MAKKANIKLANRKVGLPTYHWTDLFKTMILIDYLCPATISKGDTGFARSQIYHFYLGNASYLTIK